MLTTNELPIVSVITPGYNCGSVVHQLLDSLLSQTYTNIEFIFLNDGSTDNTESVVLSYEKKFVDKGIKFIYFFQENKGVGAATDVLLKMFTGEYLCWIDPDDFLVPVSIEMRLQFMLENEQYGMLTSDAYIVEAENIYQSIGMISNRNPNRFEEDHFRYTIEEDSILCPGCHMIRTSCFLDVNPNRSIYPSRGGQNWQLLLPVLYKYKRAYIDIPLYYYVVYPQSHSRGDDTQEKKLKRLKDHEDILLHTLQSIQMLDDDREKYTKLILHRYAEKRLRVAYNYKDRKLLREQNKLLARIYHTRSHMDYLYYCCGINPVMDFVARKILHRARNIKSAGTSSIEIGNFGLLINHSKADCTGCSACQAICPEGCIVMQTDNEGFLYPQIDHARCIRCGRCEQTCHLRYSQHLNRKRLAYGCYSTDDMLRSKSSSGGLFTLLAKAIIMEGGVVFGAALDATQRVEHICVSTIDELTSLRGSKYVQSQIKETFRKAEAFLQEGKKVLFTGTPCQIAGLRAYLGKEYGGLFCQDIICHGVPSPKVWQKYVDWQEDKNASCATKVAFRSKEMGWTNFSLALTFLNGRNYRKSLHDDMFLQLFLNNVCLRPSCFDCHFKDLDRQADITLADFWGVEIMMPEMFDDRGVSLVLIHSEKGQVLFNMVRDSIEYKKVDDIGKAMVSNSAAISSVSLPSSRQEFFRDMERIPFQKVLQRYGKANLRQRITRLMLKLATVIKRVILSRCQKSKAI